MIPPFLRVNDNKIYLRLRKNVYSKELILEAQKTHSDLLESVKNQKAYFLLKLNLSSINDCFDFLNYLIYLRRSL